MCSPGYPWLWSMRGWYILMLSHTHSAAQMPTAAIEVCMHLYIVVTIYSSFGSRGICLFRLYSHETCGFSTFLYVAVVTHVTQRDVLHELHKVTSGTKRRDSCSSSFLLSNAPESAQRCTTRNWAREESWIGPQNATILAVTEHTSIVDTPCCDDLWANIMRLSCVRSPFVSVVTSKPQLSYALMPDGKVE